MGTVFFMSLILLMYLWQHLPFNRKVGVLLFFFSGLAINVLVFMILYYQLALGLAMVWHFVGITVASVSGLPYERQKL